MWLYVCISVISVCGYLYESFKMHLAAFTVYLAVQTKVEQPAGYYYVYGNNRGRGVAPAVLPSILFPAMRKI